MKYVGFIKEIDDVGEDSKTFEQLSKEKRLLDDYTFKRVIYYLQSGVVVSAWMGYFKDIFSNESVAPHFYSTDGTWIWPSYFPYYLGKYDSFKLDTDFLEYIKSQNFEIQIGEDYVNCRPEIETEFLSKFRHNEG